MPSSGTTYSLNKHPLRGLSPQDIYELKIAKQKIDSVFSKKKSVKYQTVRNQLTASIDAILLEKMPRLVGAPGEKLSEVKTQELRDDVLLMVKKSCPLNGIKRFRGKLVDGDPIEFFKNQYSKFIRRGNEVIFSPDLLKIDPALLAAMRNAVKADKMPIGTRVERTNAIVEGRFSDSPESKYAAASALATRKKREKRAKGHAQNA